MTTNETYWFRDNYPFDWFRQYLSDRKVARPRIWSAACSSGQEPFSLSIIAKECASQLSLVGTDISPTMLDYCREGVYDKLAMARGLSPERQASHFTQSGEKHWRFDDEQRRKIDFRSLNLMDSYAGMGVFDIIFCRNVLIYFEMELKRDVLRRMHKCLTPGGYLFLGASEGLAGVEDLFEMINCRPGICYRAI
jgi:chemotaxis protein methyltransferase CheR